MVAEFPMQQPGLNYLTEGGQETEIMYKYGYELPHFAMFPLLDNPRAVTELRGMYGRYLDTAASHAFAVIIGGLDYRASPDWGSLLGYSRESLAEMQIRAIEFLRDVAAPYRGQVPSIMYAGIVGPRGDACMRPTGQSPQESSEQYHGEQLATLATRRRRPGRSHDVQLGAGNCRAFPCRGDGRTAAGCRVHTRQQHQRPGVGAVLEGRHRDDRRADGAMTGLRSTASIAHTRWSSCPRSSRARGSSECAAYVPMPP